MFAISSPGELLNQEYCDGVSPSPKGLAPSKSATGIDYGFVSFQNLVYFGPPSLRNCRLPLKFGSENVLNHPASAAATREKYVRDWILG